MTRRGATRLLWIRAVRAPLAAAGAMLAIETGGGDLAPTARMALAILALATVGWLLTPLPEWLVAAAAALCMLAVGGAPGSAAVGAAGNLVALMLGGFVLAAGLRRSGWLDALVGAVARRAGSIRALCQGLAVAMLLLAFVIPSTAARAALLVPVVAALAAGTGGGPRLLRALALLAATTVLLSAFASLLGAGAHIVAAEILAGMTGETIGFGRWALLGIPFAAASVLLSTEVILRLFLTPAERRAAPPSPPERTGAAPPQPAALWIAGTTVAGWLGTPLHGVDEGIVALIGALAMVWPRHGVLSLRDAAGDIDWSLLGFATAVALLAHGLMASGLAASVAGGALGATPGEAPAGLAVIGVIAAVGIAAHLVVPSRTARVGILLPPALLLGAGAGLPPLLVMLATVAATGVCQTLPASAKPVMLLGRIDGRRSYGSLDLLRLSAVLMPLHLGLIVLFAGVVWPLLGAGIAAVPR